MLISGAHITPGVKFTKGIYTADGARFDISSLTNWSGANFIGTPTNNGTYKSFNGSQYIETSGIDITTLTNDDYTYEFWLRTTGSNGGAVLAKLAGGGFGYHVSAIELTNGYLVRGHWLGSFATADQVPTVVTRDVWQHYTVAYNESTLTVKTYINGQAVSMNNTIGAESSPRDYGESPMVFRMFGTETTSFGNGNPLTCDFGEFRYYARTLTDAEVAQNFSATRGRWGI